MDKAEMKNLDAATLKNEIEHSKKELFNLKLGVISGQVKDYSQFRKLRTKIARALTYLNQKERTKLSKEA